MADEDYTPTVVNDEADVDTATEESTTEETTGLQESQDTQESSDEQNDASDEEAEELDENGEPKTRADVRKEQLKEQADEANREIRELVAKKNELIAQRDQLRQEVTSSITQAYQPASVEELLSQENPETGEYYNRLEAQLEAMRQEREVERYANQVANAQLQIQQETQQALEEFPMFDSESPEFNVKAAQELDAILRQSLRVDPQTGAIVGSNISPYQLCKTIAVAAKSTAVQAEQKAQRNVEKMLNNSDVTTGGKGAAVPFEKMSLAQQEAHLRKKGHDI